MGDHSCACASVLHKAVSSLLSVYTYGIQDREGTMVDIFKAMVWTMERLNWKHEKKGTG
jgi:uncharacterized protein YxjI